MVVRDAFIYLYYGSWMAHNQKDKELFFSVFQSRSSRAFRRMQEKTADKKTNRDCYFE
ncbi:Uncharacterised protein [Chlamydia trachomatis]|nr:Uncharacterised protein [Chlamydia trachomatis]